MSEPGAVTEESLALAESIAQAMLKDHRTVAVAESLTSGSLGCHLGAAAESSQWFQGGVIAYAPEVKFSVLGVDPGPVVTAACARQMAIGVARLMDAAIGVALTGVGGPGAEEGKPAGTVFIAVSAGDDSRVEEHRFDGDPAAVVRAATHRALAMLLESSVRTGSYPH
ncbi:CinA family protein [Parafrigoribacterium mesophilum]|uniref:CinA family protein n=1 Tax=Parafrigoribacterium mesophilum TaxID=433646 RepID=UPI0031FE1647